MSNLRLGFFFMLAAAFTYSVISCFSYSLEMRLSTSQILFFQDLIALLTLLPWLKYKKHSLKTAHFPLHLIRDIAALAACFFWLMSLQSLSLVNSHFRLSLVPRKHSSRNLESHCIRICGHHSYFETEQRYFDGWHFLGPAGRYRIRFGVNLFKTIKLKKRAL